MTNENDDLFYYDTLYFITVNTNKTINSFTLYNVSLDEIDNGMKEYFKNIENTFQDGITFIEGKDDNFRSMEFELRDIQYEIGPRNKRFHWHILIRHRHQGKANFKKRILQDEMKYLLNKYLPDQIKYYDTFPYVFVKFKTFKSLESEMKDIEDYIAKTRGQNL